MQRVNSLAGSLLVVSVLMVVPVGVAQEAPKSAAEEAATFFQAQEWEKAAAAYEAIVKEEPKHAVAWFRLGVARQSLKQHEAAVEAYEEARKHGFPLAVLPLRAAIASTQLNRSEGAIEWLEKAVAAGLNPRLLKGLSELDPLRETPQFQELLARHERPCGQPEHRVFDFWIGEWDVETRQGQHVGVNRIEKILGGCVLLENWTADSGGEGKSFNFYNPGTGQWTQTWVDDSGRILEVPGEFRDGAMRFEGEVYQKDGTKILDRMTFFPLGPDRVRQLIEYSGDGGKTWVTWFDGIYTRRMSAGASEKPSK